MRISADERDPDFIGAHNYGRYFVQINHNLLKDCLEADDKAGYAIVFMRDDNGRFDFDRTKHEIRTHRIEGDVKIIDTRAVH